MMTSAEMASSLRFACEISDFGAVSVVQAQVVEVQILLHVELHFWKVESEFQAQETRRIREWRL